MTVRVSLTVEPGPGSERGEETAAAVATLKTEHENTIHGSSQLPPLSTSAARVRAHAVSAARTECHITILTMTTVSVSVLSPLETSVWWRRLISCGRASGRVQQSGFPGLGGG